MEDNGILVTGGSGLLGTALKELIPAAQFPSHSEFDIINAQDELVKWMEENEPNLIIHAAAITGPATINEDPMSALETNITGTANVVRLAHQFGARLVYLSTDYVFKGDEGHYSEDDPVLPGAPYAWSKLGGECAVMLHDNSLVIRTSFGPNEFPFPKAYYDQFTSRETVNDIAEKVLRAAKSDLTGILHIGSKRRSVLEYARTLNESVEGTSIESRTDNPPLDTSLSTLRYQQAFEAK